MHKGVYGVSDTPLTWPTRFYENRYGEIDQQCSICDFIAVNPRQIELHQSTDINPGPKLARTSEYYTTEDIQPMCANCHSLQHRTGEKLCDACGKWYRSLPRTLKHKNPDNIFSDNCSDTYRLQKSYFLKWYLKSSSQYKCQNCGVDTWGPENKLLSLEVYHKDKKHSNSLISNLVLLCPNCHRNEP